MSNKRGYDTFQVHANVNSDRGDNALRVSITFYDEHGFEITHKTWRGRAQHLQVLGSDWTAYSAIVDLCKMLGTACSGHAVEHIAVDTPLPGMPSSVLD